MAQLLRDNAADARVGDDISALVAAYDEAGIAEAAEQHLADREHDIALLTELFARSDEPTEPLARRVGAHLARYRSYYVIAALVLGVVFFRSPEPLPFAAGEDSGGVFIPTVDGTQAGDNASAVDTTPVAAPYTDPFPVATTPFEFAFVAPQPHALADTNPAPAAPGTPTPLRFTQTGYASTLGGTPLDQPAPGNSLPTEVVAGAVTKYSYARLSGQAKTLKLRALADDGAAMNASLARVQLCQITSGWTPSRATPTQDAPAYNDSCVEGAAAAGVWTFNFSTITDPLSPNGWAIVPVLDGNQTFRVTFAGAAL